MCHVSCGLLNANSAVGVDGQARLQRLSNVFIFPSRVLIALTKSI